MGLRTKLLGSGTLTFGRAPHGATTNLARDDQPRSGRGWCWSSLLTLVANFELKNSQKCQKRMFNN